MTRFDYVRAAITGALAWLLMEVGARLAENYLAQKGDVITLSMDVALVLRATMSVCVGVTLLYIRSAAPALRTTAMLWMVGLLFIFSGVERLLFMLDLPPATFLYIASASAAMGAGTLITILRERGLVLRTFGDVER